jgi:hypothetical protein
VIVNVTNQNDTVLQNVKRQMIVHAASYVKEDHAEQNVILVLVHKVNYVKEMFALKDVVGIQIVLTTCHVLKANAKIHVLIVSAERKQFAVQQIIEHFVFVPTDSPENLQ